ncbi:MAG: phenylalanine--tRNA ligase subunit beta [Chloroflexota bacterium]
MLVPLSWLKDYVDIDVPIELLAEKITLAGLEVAKLHYIGIPQGKVEGVRLPPSDHLVWDHEKLLLGAVREVKPHPDADKLVLAMVDYGADELEQCVTGAPNLFDYMGKGELASPLWTIIALEGAEVWDGHSDEPKRTILKGKPLRGIHNKSMVCSEKELGISDAHEGIILLHDQPANAQGEAHTPGTPAQDVFGDVVLEIELTPNLARTFSIIGIAREVAAILDKELKYPSFEFVAEGAPIDGAVELEIREPELNPRFTFTLLRNTKVQPSPEWMQHRLRLVGQRPINNFVDVTNYITFELGQPLHAFDYDKLVERAKGGTPKITTRLPEDGETLETLDGVSRKLLPENILVTDEAGVLSMGGVMGGGETEISDETTTVLLEAAAWNFINIRKTQQAQKLFTEAGTRFSRGVHPSQAILGVQRGIELMRQTGGGEVAQGVVDEYPLPPESVEIELPIAEVHRIMGMDFAIETAADILRRLEFDVEYSKDTIRVTVPDHRMDISTGVVGRADLIEEIARVNGYDVIPSTIIADEMPSQVGNPYMQAEEDLRDLLATLGLRENVSYRFTTPEREAQLVPAGEKSSLPEAGYVTMANPIAADKTVLRHTILVNLLENAASNSRYQQRQAVFEIGSIYLKHDEPLPDELPRLGLLMTGTRSPINDWSRSDGDALMDFFDIKGTVDSMMHGLNITNYTIERSQHTTFHPGRSAALHIDGNYVGDFGELHPRVAKAFALDGPPVFIAEFDLDAALHHSVDTRIAPLPVTPPVLQDIALVVDETIPAGEVEMVIRQAGGDILREVQLFDVYTGESITEGKKSIAYSLTFQTDEKTLTDKEVAKIQKKIVKSAKARLGAELRS